MKNKTKRYIIFVCQTYIYEPVLCHWPHKKYCAFLSPPFFLHFTYCASLRRWCCHLWSSGVHACLDFQQFAFFYMYCHTGL